MGLKDFFKSRSLKVKDNKRTKAAELTLRESIYPIALVTVLFFLWGFSYGLLDTLNVGSWRFSLSSIRPMPRDVTPRVCEAGLHRRGVDEGAKTMTVILTNSHRNISRTPSTLPRRDQLVSKEHISGLFRR